MISVFAIQPVRGVRASRTPLRSRMHGGLVMLFQLRLVAAMQFLTLAPPNRCHWGAVALDETFRVTRPLYLYVIPRVRPLDNCFEVLLADEDV